MSEIIRDAHGYLIDLNIWSEDIVRKLMDEDGIEFTIQKWNQICTLREYYINHGIIPPIWKMVKYLRSDINSLKQIWNSSKPLDIIIKYSGIPKQTPCTMSAW